MIAACSSTNIQIPFFYVYFRFYHGIRYGGDFGIYMIMRCLFYATTDVETISGRTEIRMLNLSLKNIDYKL